MGRGEGRGNGGWHREGTSQGTSRLTADGGGFRKDNKVHMGSVWGHSPGRKGQHRGRNKVLVESVMRA